MSTNNTDSVAAFLARGGAVTKCPPADGNAPSLRSLRKSADRAADRGQTSVNVLARRDGVRIDPSQDSGFESEQRAERQSEAFGAARASGLSMSDALDDYNDAY